MIKGPDKILIYGKSNLRNNCCLIILVKSGKISILVSAAEMEHQPSAAVVSAYAESSECRRLLHVGGPFEVS